MGLRKFDFLVKIFPNGKDQPEEEKFWDKKETKKEEKTSKTEAKICSGKNRPGKTENPWKSLPACTPSFQRGISPAPPLILHPTGEWCDYGWYWDFLKTLSGCNCTVSGFVFLWHLLVGVVKVGNGPVFQLLFWCSALHTKTLMSSLGIVGWSQILATKFD